MIAQSLLSLLLCSVLVYAWVEYRRSPVVSLLAVVTAIAGLYFVWAPEDSTRIAAFVGIGRGADLILYLWICISLVVLLNLHLKLRRQHEVITKLARAMALADASEADESVPWVVSGSAQVPAEVGGRLRQTRDQTV